MKLIADTHTHTIISGDAFSTLYENIQAARKRGIKYLCLTEHVYSALPGAPTPSYFKSMHALPQEIDGVQLIRGVEVNILDYNGHLDMPPDLLEWLEWVIASMHPTVIQPKDKKAHTKAWLAIAENPAVDVIGHCDDPRYPFDIDQVVHMFARHGKIMALNEQSPVTRPGGDIMRREILTACVKHSLPIVVSSDGHFVDKIGVFQKSIALLQELHFPEELVLNADEKRFAKILSEKRHKL